MKKLIVVFIIILAIVLFYKLAKMFSPGSYPNSEIYEVDMSDSLLVQKIRAFKHENPSRNVPPITELTDGNSENGNRYICYFYYKEENQIILTWVRSIDKKHCQFAIVSINNGLELGKWKELNNDYGYLETVKEREKFEDKILKNLSIPFKRESFF